MSHFVKSMIIGEIESQIENVPDIVIVDFSKMDAVTNNRFRLNWKTKGISALTVKNSLARRAFANIGIELNGMLRGPSTLVWGAKDIVELSKELEIKAPDIPIKGGITEGVILSPNEVTELSKSPSRTELIGEIVSRILRPGAQLTQVINAPGENLAGQIKTLSEGDEANNSSKAESANIDYTQSDIASPKLECSNTELEVGTIPVPPKEKFDSMDISPKSKFDPKFQRVVTTNSRLKKLSLPIPQHGSQDCRIEATPLELVLRIELSSKLCTAQVQYENFKQFLNVESNSNLFLNPKIYLIVERLTSGKNEITLEYANDFLSSKNNPKFDYLLENFSAYDHCLLCLESDLGDVRCYFGNEEGTYTCSSLWFSENVSEAADAIIKAFHRSGSSESFTKLCNTSIKQVLDKSMNFLELELKKRSKDRSDNAN